MIIYVYFGKPLFWWSPHYLGGLASFEFSEISIVAHQKLDLFEMDIYLRFTKYM